MVVGLWAQLDLESVIPIHSHSPHSTILPLRVLCVPTSLFLCHPFPPKLGASRNQNPRNYPQVYQETTTFPKTSSPGFVKKIRSGSIFLTCVPQFPALLLSSTNWHFYPPSLISKHGYPDVKLCFKNSYFSKNKTGRRMGAEEQHLGSCCFLFLAKSAQDSVFQPHF